MVYRDILKAIPYYLACDTMLPVISCDTRLGVNNPVLPALELELERDERKSRGVMRMPTTCFDNQEFRIWRCNYAALRSGTDRYNAGWCGIHWRATY